MTAQNLLRMTRLSGLFRSDYSPLVLKKVDFPCDISCSCPLGTKYTDEWTIQNGKEGKIKMTFELQDHQEETAVKRAAEEASGATKTSDASRSAPGTGGRADAVVF